MSVSVTPTSTRTGVGRVLRWHRHVRAICCMNSASGWDVEPDLHAARGPDGLVDGMRPLQNHVDTRTVSGFRRRL
jgi:hypothetical protein